ncbi:hypothetical protein CLOM_g2447 [Closterium sp. NIES-68]|nr:hypothetical protein CLOM_g2447 [Closterium sp. NIES-68]GJP74367.1 hypothetical protein CLOP_g4959 [Closterium sp. NIES-67]
MDAANQNELDLDTEPSLKRQREEPVGKSKIDTQDNFGQPDSLEARDREPSPAVAEVHKRIEDFTQKLCTILDAGKQALSAAHAAWEEQLVQIHENQIEIWQRQLEEIKELESMNDEIGTRLLSAQNVFDRLQPAVAERHLEE